MMREHDETDAECLEDDLLLVACYAMERKTPKLKIEEKEYVMTVYTKQIVDGIIENAVRQATRKILRLEEVLDVWIADGVRSVDTSTLMTEDKTTYTSGNCVSG